MASVFPYKKLRSKDFTGFIKKTDQHFGTEHLISEHLDVKTTRNHGYAELYHNGEFINYDNGFRRTIGNVANTEKRIWLFGPCIVLGAYVSDDDTIPSLMQKKLGDEYLLMNRGQPNAIGLNLLMRSCDFKAGDIVMYFAKDIEMAGCPGYDLIHSYNKISRLNQHISDSLMHCDAVVNAVLADDLAKLLLKHNREDLEVHATVQRGENVWFGGSQKILPEIYMLQNSAFQEYLDSIKGYFKDGNNGAIVMNCNPFTNGHLYLITEAAKRVDTLYVFVVEEDKSFFPFDDRIELVRRGTSHIPNICVLNSGDFVISSTTLPGYFEKDQVGDIYLDASNDMMLFLQIAKTMHIKTRFAGSEPIDKFTAQYNDNMRKYLTKYGVAFIEIERVGSGDGQVISASNVRKCLKERNFEKIRSMVPESTYLYLVENY